MPVDVLRIYCTVQHHMLCFKTQLLLLYYFCRLVFSLPTFVDTRNSLYVRCMENHVKTSVPNSRKKGVLYILKLVRYANSGENGTAVHIKTSMLLVEITGMLYMGNLKIRFVRV